ncbi:MAG: hypothetical protein AAF799_45245 [Myxococcota bacterium]
MESDPMPRAMRWLLVAMGLQLVVDLAMLLWGPPAASVGASVLEVGALLVDAGVLLMLVRATELARVLVRGAAGVGMAIDAWILLGGLAFMPRDLGELQVRLGSVALVAASMFAWVVLGRDDVKAWIFARWLRKHGG